MTRDRGTLLACLIAGSGIGAMVGLSYSTGISATVVGGLMAVVAGFLTVADFGKVAEDEVVRRREAIEAGWWRVAMLSAAIAVAAIIAAQFRASEVGDAPKAGPSTRTVAGLMSENISPRLCSTPSGSWREIDLVNAVEGSENATLKLMATRLGDAPEGGLEKLAGAVDLYCLARKEG